MALETGNYISDLVQANPTLSDPVSQGDDHLRLIKTCLKQTFPVFNGPVSVSSTQLNNAVLAIVPGLITCWGSSTAPTGWKMCNGSGITSDGQPIPNLNTAFRIGSTYWIIKD